MSDERPSVPRSAARLEVGWVSGAHGLRGALNVRTHDPASTSVAEGVEVVLVQPETSATQSFVVRSAVPRPGKPGHLRVELVGVDDRTRAESLEKHRIEIAREELPALGGDEFYLADAIGLPVERERDGSPQHLGHVIGVVTGGAQDMFEVEWKDPSGRRERWLLPVIPQFITDVDETRVLVDLPLGLLPDGLE